MPEASELDACRHSTSFSIPHLTAMLDTEGRQRLKQDILSILMREPAFDKRKRPFLSRPEALQYGVAATRRLIQLRRQHRWTQEQLNVAIEVLGDTYGLTLHELAFKPVIASQASDEQQAYWLPLASEYAIFGCYAQTELGHGSNVQSLETTATYIPELEQFEIHSPTLTSTKWWMGGLGVLASHCIVQAQLIVPVDGKPKHYGPHLFIMRIRDERNHLPLDGIRIGDIGPKAHGAMAGLDNGYIRFNHVRVPRNAMLSRFAQLSPSGIYKVPPHSKLSYGGMIYIRAQMISSLARGLAKSATIATRYLHVRRQFRETPQSPETRVIQYPSVYMRIIPTIVNAYVFTLLGRQMVADYTAMASRLKQGDTALLAQVHAVSSGLKIYVSNATVEGSEVCRRACGGHGFLASAGLAAIYAHQLPSTTYEGDNYILNQQVCRAAVKAQAGAAKVDERDSSPLGCSPDGSAKMIKLLELRKYHMVKQLASKKTSKTSWTSLSWECAAVAKAVTEADIAKHLEHALNDLSSPKANNEESKALTRLYEFWLFLTVESARADLLEFGLLNPQQLASFRTQIKTMASALLPDLVGLTDAFGYSDWELDSTLGGAAGRPYEELLEYAETTADLNLGDIDHRAEVLAMLQEGRSGLSAIKSRL